MREMVSIIIPVYNGKDYMREAIDSALNQTYDNIEVIVINDGSDDDGATRRVAMEYGNRIRYFEKNNGGVSSALNYGINVMKGTCFSWLSHDDVYLPDKIESEVKALRAYPESDVIVYCRCSTINEKSKIISDKSKSNILQTNQLIESKDVLKYLLKYGSLNGCGLLIHKSVFEKCGLFDENLRYAQDALMWYKIFAKGYSLYVVPNQAVKSRVHKQQQTIVSAHLYSKDSDYICSNMLPVFSEISTPGYDYVFFLARKNAIHGHRDDVNRCIQQMKADENYSIIKHIKLVLFIEYSRVRPLLKKLYHFIKKACK